MITIEQVEKLRNKANVTYEEAKTALEATSGDMLEAIILLEKQGRVEPPQNGGSYSTSEQSEEKSEENTTSDKESGGESFRQLLGRFSRWIVRLVAKGNANSFEVWRNEKQVISVPVTVLVILLCFAFWIAIPLIILGLFFGCRYVFRGPDLEKTKVNTVMDSAAEVAEKIKKDVKES